MMAVCVTRSRTPRALPIIFLLLSLVDALYIRKTNHGETLTHEEMAWEAPKNEGAISAISEIVRIANEPVTDLKCKEKERKSFDRMDCCFDQESRRLKKIAATKGEIGIFNSVLGFIPEVGDVLQATSGFGGATYETISEISELNEQNCQALAAENIFHNIENTRAEAKKKFDQVLKQTEKANELAKDSLQKISSTQKQLTALEKNLDKHMSSMTTSFNTLAAKLDQLSLKVIQYGELARQSTYNELAIKMRVSFAGVSNAFASFVLLAEAAEQHNLKLSTIIKQVINTEKQVTDTDKERKEGLKKTLGNWLGASQTISADIRSQLRPLWMSMQNHFSAMAAVLSEGDFLKAYNRENIQLEANTWITEMTAKMGTNECSKLLTEDNIAQLLKKIVPNMVHDGMLGMIRATVARALLMAVAMDIVFPQSPNNPNPTFATFEFQRIVKTIAVILQEFQTSLKSRTSFGHELDEILSVLLPAHCAVDVKCATAAFEAGRANTDLMVMWTKQDDKFETVIAVNPACRIFDATCHVQFLSCLNKPQFSGRAEFTQHPEHLPIDITQKSLSSSSFGKLDKFVSDIVALGSPDTKTPKTAD